MCVAVRVRGCVCVRVCVCGAPHRPTMILSTGHQSKSTGCCRHVTSSVPLSHKVQPSYPQTTSPVVYGAIICNARPLDCSRLHPQPQ